VAPRVVLQLGRCVAPLVRMLRALATASAPPRDAGEPRRKGGSGDGRGRRLGSAGLEGARVLAALMRCRWREVWEALEAAAAVPALLATVEAFPEHNLLHGAIADAILDVLELGTTEARAVVLVGRTTGGDRGGVVQWLGRVLLGGSDGGGASAKTTGEEGVAGGRVVRVGGRGVG